MCPSGESHVPECELLGREQGKRVRRRAGQYPPARLLLPAGLAAVAMPGASRPSSVAATAGGWAMRSATRPWPRPGRSPATPHRAENPQGARRSAIVTTPTAPVHPRAVRRPSPPA
jgi:hypothetical protein